MSLWLMTKMASAVVDQGITALKPRTLNSVLHSATSELGECAEEINIHEGHSYKKPGKDGIVGEAIDTILCLLDLIHVYDPTITEDVVENIAKQKLKKWVRNATNDGLHTYDKQAALQLLDSLKTLHGENVNVLKAKPHHKDCEIVGYGVCTCDFWESVDAKEKG